MDLANEINIEPMIPLLPTVGYRSPNGLSLLMATSMAGRIDIVKYLCEVHNVAINVIDFNGKTALMHAAMCGMLAVVKLLVDIITRN